MMANMLDITKLIFSYTGNYTDELMTIGGVEYRVLELNGAGGRGGSGAEDEYCEGCAYSASTPSTPGQSGTLGIVVIRIPIDQ